jgi:hypothetical protein
MRNWSIWQRRCHKELRDTQLQYGHNWLSRRNRDNIASKIITISQAASPLCTYSLSPTTAAYLSDGGTGTTNVISACSRTGTLSIGGKTYSVTQKGTTGEGTNPAPLIAQFQGDKDAAVIFTFDDTKASHDVEVRALFNKYSTKAVFCSFWSKKRLLYKHFNPL